MFRLFQKKCIYYFVAALLSAAVQSQGHKLARSILDLSIDDLDPSGKRLFAATSKLTLIKGDQESFECFIYHPPLPRPAAEDVFKVPNSRLSRAASWQLASSLGNFLSDDLSS